MKMTDLEFYVEDFLTFCQNKNLSRKTILSYDQTLKLFLAYLKNEHGVEKITEVRTGHIRQYVAYVQERGKYTVVNRESSKLVNFPENRTDYKKPISTITVNNYIRNIKVLFNWLQQEGELVKNPVDNISLIKTVRRQKKGINQDEFNKLLEQFDYTTFHGYRNKIIVLLLQDTGMRIGECLELGVDAIDFKHKMILLTKTKGNKERYVYFSNVMGRELKQYLKHRDRYTETSLLFPTTKGTTLSVQSFEKQLRDAGRNAGVEVHPHQIRNNFARQYLLNGGDFYTLSRILGHSSVTVTEQAYMDLTREEIAKKYQNHSPLGRWKIQG
ncbi:integrase [Paenibacillus chitinolyticus]|uniref:Integrase n=1 Tax=Paenibacillus chitinolyticus TaxID=79263 RepID=A0A410WVA8_9BACL|nr:tyrosine-type recombinase/integrase [Paenibacillus chitinolyticus]MCY9589476.1 tyrosine-type recombinase/integrase [Paenibacillus chitinolyticus]MCY9599246.1 tyrosine-type recombinase/integrase [Paenibacillus chitinolyticus]QAV18207.1 integrase [Paenibacillus chitinolyticus]